MDFKNQKAIYLQIAERIMDQILSGQYPEGGKLPSVREYAAEVEVNVNTVARSFEWLQNQDVVVTRRGLGNFVNEGARQIVLELRKREFFNEQVPEFFRTMKTLGVTLNEIVSYSL
ncbi:MAG: GntR family transcriptional regulator [Bacteroidaceae bacterium]|nr:GntR family transcriptional regulator [Bacteroidaceae bacterium]